MNYWIFQCNPDAIGKNVDIETAIRDRHPFFQEWRLSQYKDEIKKGDKAIIWVTGKNARMVALADITSNRHPKMQNTLWNAFNKTGERLKNDDNEVVSIDTYSLTKSISKDKIKLTKGMENFGAGRRATNIPLAPSEYDIILNLTQ